MKDRTRIRAINHAVSSKAMKALSYSVYVSMMADNTTKVEWIVDYNLDQFGRVVGLAGE